MSSPLPMLVVKGRRQLSVYDIGLSAVQVLLILSAVGTSPFSSHVTMLMVSSSALPPSSSSSSRLYQQGGGVGLLMPRYECCCAPTDCPERPCFICRNIDFSCNCPACSCYADSQPRRPVDAAAVNVDRDRDEGGRERSLRPRTGTAHRHHHGTGNSRRHQHRQSSSQRQQLRRSNRGGNSPTNRAPADDPNNRGPLDKQTDGTRHRTSSTTNAPSRNDERTD